MLSFELIDKHNFLSDVQDSSDPVKLANFLCFQITRGLLSQEKKLIYQKVEKLLESKEDAIRYIIARKLCYSETIPSSIARKLVYDKHEIARKVILYSPKILEVDLLDLMNKTTDERVLIAIAKRAEISELVTTALVEKNDNRLIVELLSNKTAKISNSSYQQIISRNQHNKEIMNLVNNRGELSEEDVNEILDSFDSSIRKTLISTYGFSRYNKLRFSRTNILGLNDRDISNSKEACEIKQRIDLLYSKNLLGPLLLLRQLCKGDLFSFVYSVSKITDVSFLNLCQVIFVSGTEEEFSQIYHKIMLPEHCFHSVRILKDLIRIELASGDLSYENFSTKIYPKFEQSALDQSVKGAKYILSLVN